MERSKIQESARQRKAPETEIDTEIERSGHCLCLTSVSRVSISHPLGQAYGNIHRDFFRRRGKASESTHLHLSYLLFRQSFALYYREGLDESSLVDRRDVMNRASPPREILYYGSNRQQQYWENEAQTLRIVRDISSPMWLAYSKQAGVYRLLPAQPQPKRRRSRTATETVPLAGRSAEEVIARLRKNHRLHLFLEQRLRRWMDKASGERVLAFLDPNQGGAPVMADPGQPPLR